MAGRSSGRGPSDVGIVTWAPHASRPDESLPPEAFLAGYDGRHPRARRDARGRSSGGPRPTPIERVRPGWRLIGYDLPVGRRSVYFAFVAPEPIHVHLGFEHGIFMADPDRRLEGAHLKLKKVRFTTFRPDDVIPEDAMVDLTREAARIAAMSREERLALRSTATDGRRWRSRRGSRPRCCRSTRTRWPSVSGGTCAATRGIPATPRRSSGPASRRAGTAGRSPPARATSTCSGPATSGSRPRRWCGSGRERVRASLAYALDVWERRRSHVTTTINYGGRPADVFAYGVDSLPLLLAALRAAGATDLVERHRAWLTAEIADYTRGSSTRRPVSSARTGRTAPIATRSSIGARPTATRWSRCWRRRSPRRAGSSRRSSAVSRATRIDCWSSSSGWATGSATRSARTRSSGEANVWPFYAGVVRIRAMLRRGPGATSTPMGSATRIRCATRRRAVPSARSGSPGTSCRTTRAAPSGPASARCTSSCSNRRPGPRRRGRSRATSSWIERDGTYWEVLDGRGRPGSARAACSSARSRCSGRRSSSTCSSSPRRGRRCSRLGRPIPDRT